MELLYPDRKMLKWQGFFLSEHQEAFSDEQNEQHFPELGEQSPEEIGEILEIAWKTKQTVLVQCKERTIDGELTSILATVEGFSENVVFLLEKARIHTVMIDQLQAVELIEETRWFQ